ncbi:MAG: hypothetical protein ACREOF_00590 [Gemmatimonadales bacterium]
MELDALVTPGTIAYTALVVLATFVLTRSRCPRALVDENGVGDVIGETGLDPDACPWKMRVLALAKRRCTIHVSGRPVQLRRGDVLVALRPQPRGRGGGDAPAPQAAVAVNPAHETVRR